MPVICTRIVFEGWIIQKVAALQYVVLLQQKYINQLLGDQAIADLLDE